MAGRIDDGGYGGDLMSTRWMRVAAVVAGVMLAGACVREPVAEKVVVPEKLTLNRAMQFVKKSPAFKEFQSRNPEYECLVDSENDREVELAFGPVNPVMFHRELTLKVLSDGRVYEYDVLSQTDDMWVLNHSPGR